MDSIPETTEDSTTVDDSILETTEDSTTVDDSTTDEVGTTYQVPEVYPGNLFEHKISKLRTVCTGSSHGYSLLRIVSLRNNFKSELL